MEKRSRIRVKAKILFKHIHIAPGISWSFQIWSDQNRIKHCPIFALLRCWSILFLSVAGVAVHICMVTACWLLQEGNTQGPLPGWFCLIKQCQKAHFWCHLCVSGRKWSPWDERGSDDICTDPALQFCMVAGVMSLMWPQEMSRVLMMSKVFPMHWTAFVQMHWRLLIIIMEYNGILKTVT